ncbi:hypothetical protein A5685_15740 [Mycobacterium colombiense]|uniref:Amidohydrolase-related domain-containing protein n=1 Tax=Mycobacterium colombiense TaxID=339268 RepID=A0A1A2RIR6_9MYCO|nr:hypothetical protein A5685_15740 [Mycobacterium colombiense]
MQAEDLILVSIDDHVVEPPDMFLRHVPAKYKDEAPIVVNENGIDTWMYQGKPQGVSGLNAVVSWPPEEWAKVGKHIEARMPLRSMSRTRSCTS